jgi:hypothetical protein
MKTEVNLFGKQHFFLTRLFLMSENEISSIFHNSLSLAFAPLPHELSIDISESQTTHNFVVCFRQTKRASEKREEKLISLGNSIIFTFNAVRTLREACRGAILAL